MPQTATAPTGANPLGYERIPKLIARFAVPAIISMLVNAIYNIVDQIFIGHSALGMMGIAATTVALPVTTICTALGLLLGVGGSANFNLKLGGGDKDSATHYIGNSITAMVVAGVAFAGGMLLFLRPLTGFFGATEAMMPLALPYTGIISAGIPFLIVSTGLTYIIRADGSPTYSMTCMLAGAIFNVVFDPIFLFVFGMGIEGIALATFLGQVLSCGLGVLYMVRRFSSVKLSKPLFRPKASVMRTIAALGMGPCFNQLAMTVVQIAMNNVLRHYGAQSSYGSEIPLAVVGAISKINILFLSLIIGTAQGCQPINSFNFGAKQYGRVIQTIKTALVISSCMAVFSFLAFQLFPVPLMRIFGEDDPVYMNFAVTYLRTSMMMAFMNGIQPVVANFFTAIGKGKMGIVMSMTRQILFLLPLILILPSFLGIDGVMYSAPIADFAANSLALVFVVREVRRLKVLQAQQEALAAG